MNLRIRADLSMLELVARECQNLEAVVLKLFVQSLPDKALSVGGAGLCKGEEVPRSPGAGGTANLSPGPQLQYLRPEPPWRCAV